MSSLTSREIIESLRSEITALRQEWTEERINTAALRAHAERVGQANDLLVLENAAMRSEVDEWASRCAAAIWMLPETVTGGQLGEAQEKFHRERENLRRDNAALRALAVELAAIGRVWITVWGDQLSGDSVRRFGELEQQILKEVQP